MLSRRGRCWLICGRRGTNLSEASLVESAVKEVAWQRQTQTQVHWISTPVAVAIFDVHSHRFLHPLQQNSAHWKRPASGETKYILFAVNCYLCLCGICYFHSSLVAVLKNSLMIIYVSAILIWLVFHCCSNTDKWLVYFKCEIIFTMRIVWETTRQKGSKHPCKIGFNSIYHTLIDMRILIFQFVFFT